MRSMKIKFKKKDVFFFLLVITYALRAVTDAIFVSQGISSIWTAAKYATLLLAIVYGLCCLYCGGHKWKYLHILWNILGVAVAFFLISLLKMIQSGIFSTAIFENVVYMVLPAIVTVIAISIADESDIYNCFCWILCVAFFVYCVIEVGLGMFVQDSFAMISFGESMSPFESHYTSATAMALSAYFSLHRQKKGITVLSFVFSLLTFKRVFVLCSIVLFCIPLLIDVYKKVNKYVHALFAVGICAMAVGYYWCLIPENHAVLEELLGIESVYEFTSSRSGFFEYIYANPRFVNFGWGSCEAFLGRSLEMELIQMLFEVTFIGMAVFVCTYWKLAGTTIYGMIYMGFHFLNMLTSHCLQNAFVWIIVLITFTQIENDPQASWKRRIWFTC